MGQLQPKQINKLIAGVIKIVGLSVTTSTSSTVVTSQLATALSTAGSGGGSVALIQSTNNTTPGVPTSSPGNQCGLWNSTTKEKIGTDTGNYELYGRISFASSIWTLGYYYLDNTGTEQSYTFTGSDPSTIDFDFVYRFQFADFPTDGLVSIVTRNIYFDPAGGGAAAILEQLTVTATNVLSNISQAPNYPTKTILFINGKAEAAITTPAPFTLAGNVVTWNSTNAGYILETTDTVAIEYYM
jgi:hypothetical protein